MTRPKNVEAAEREERIKDALEGVKSGRFKSYREVARVIDVLNATLSARANRRLPRNQAHEDEQILTNAEETELMRWITRLTLIGYPPKPDHVKEIAKSLRMRRIVGMNNPSITYVQYHKIGKHWVPRFLARHPELASIMPEQIEAARVKESEFEVFQKWFINVKSIIDKHKIQPHNIYNMDETGFSIGSIKAMCVIIDKTKNIWYSAYPGRQEWVSVIECINMDGTVLPPFIIFKGKTLTGRWLPKDTPIDWLFSVNTQGWTSNEHMKKWLLQDFELHTRAKANGRARLLIFDGYRSHTTIDVIRHCIINHIQLALLPVHSFHIAQPLNVGVFTSMKAHMTHEMNRYVRNELPRIEKAEWLNAFINARPLAFTSKNIFSGWSSTGLRPYMPQKVLSKVLPPSAPIEPPLCQSTPDFPLENPNLTSSQIENAAMTLANKDIE
jgi:hypothetical protein